MATRPPLADAEDVEHAAEPAGAVGPLPVGDAVAPGGRGRHDALVGEQRSARWKKWTSVSGSSCIKPFMAPPRPPARDPRRSRRPSSASRDVATAWHRCDRRCRHLALRRRRRPSTVLVAWRRTTSPHWRHPPPRADPLPPPDPASRAKPRYHRLRLSTLLGTIGVLIVASNIGTILSATLVNDHPVALIALSARIRHLLLTVAAGIDPLPYFLVGFVRLHGPRGGLLPPRAVVRRRRAALAGEAGRRAARRRSGGSRRPSCGSRSRS